MYGDEFGPKIIEVMADVNERTKNLAGKGNTQFFVAASLPRCGRHATRNCRWPLLIERWHQ